MLLFEKNIATKQLYISQDSEMQSGKCIRMTAEICLCKDSKGIRPAIYGWSLGKKSARKPKHHHLISQWKTYLNFASIFFRLKIGN